jgi:dTDP-glucose 4,6-dehydratase
MAEYRPQNILLSGGAGFIGCNYIRYMITKYKNIRIVNLDKLTYAGSLDNLADLPDPSRHQFIRGDICDQLMVAKLLRQYQIDTIVHFAAESHVDRSIAGPAAFIETNILGTFSLLEAARNYWLEDCQYGQQQCRFHHISTDEVYGSLTETDPPFEESTCYAPNSPYSASKASSDHLVRAWHHTYGLPVTTSNCSNNYGPFQHPEKFIPTIIRCCLQQKPIPIYGDGSNIRDWLYVEDHCSGIDRVIRQGITGETYNIGGHNELSNIDICRLICTLMDALLGRDSSSKDLIRFVDDRLGHDWRYAVGSGKMVAQLAWEPRETLDTGIKKTIGWYSE